MGGYAVKDNGNSLNYIYDRAHQHSLYLLFRFLHSGTLELQVREHVDNSFSVSVPLYILDQMFCVGLSCAW